MLDRRTVLAGLIGIVSLAFLGKKRAAGPGSKKGDKAVCILMIMDQDNKVVVEKAFVFYRRVSSTEYEVICPRDKTMMLMKG